MVLLQKNFFRHKDNFVFETWLFMFVNRSKALERFVRNVFKIDFCQVYAYAREFMAPSIQLGNLRLPESTLY